MQNSVLKVLSTRPLSDQVINEARKDNIHIDVISFIETKEINNDDLDRQIAKLVAEKLVVIFTSMNAVNMVAKRIGSKSEWKIYCIGNTTKNLVGDYFGVDNISGVGRDAEDLAEIIIKDKVTEVTFFCGDIRRDTIPEKLRAHSIRLNEYEVYQTIETSVGVKDDYNAILFYSPSSVRSFFKSNNVSEKMIFFSIGDTTAAEITTFLKGRNNQVITAHQSDKEGLAREMIEYLKNNIN